ncbi:hypothetical protein BDW42DRAFT_176731 [Aspergillus taichungensis]|uniref:Uncharacterized protein n=1 Tax=Aspergillus taichungensis TaxID=482145 RepID=A0A2J5HK84_9EURO|nr:hypothetical protein BDW42DRAFT_176731 [Aspergillus taichungensis]
MSLTVDPANAPKFSLFGWNIDTRQVPSGSGPIGAYSIVDILSRAGMKSLTSVYFSKVHPCYGRNSSMSVWMPGGVHPHRRSVRQCPQWGRGTGVPVLRAERDHYQITPRGDGPIHPRQSLLDRRTVYRLCDRLDASGGLYADDRGTPFCMGLVCSLYSPLSWLILH